jgi:hypothetical protein
LVAPPEAFVVPPLRPLEVATPPTPPELVAPPEAFVVPPLRPLEVAAPAAPPELVAPPLGEPPLALDAPLPEAPPFALDALPPDAPPFALDTLPPDAPPCALDVLPPDPTPLAPPPARAPPELSCPPELEVDASSPLAPVCDFVPPQALRYAAVVTASQRPRLEDAHHLLMRNLWPGDGRIGIGSSVSLPDVACGRSRSLSLLSLGGG